MTQIDNSWLAYAPSDWKRLRVKQVMRRKNSKAKHDNPVVLSLARTGVKVRDITSNEGQLAESYENYNLVEPDDILLNPMDLQSGANCSISRVSGVISPAYVNLRPNNKRFDSRFFDYYFKTQYWSKAFFAYGKGVSYDNRWTLNAETVMNYPILVPDSETQKKVADYIDAETAQIDTLIAKQERLLELLEEKRRATITHAVTRGLNPGVELKETNIPWLGQIPKNWNIVRVKDIADVVLGKMVQNEQKKAEEVLKPYLKSRNIQWDGIDLSNVDEMWFKPAEIQGYSLQDNDIVVSEGGDVGKCVMWQEKFGEMYFQNSVNRVRVSGSVEAKYIYYVFQHLALNQVFMNTVNKVSIAHLTKDKIVTYHIPMPDKTEQGQIADFLDTEDKKFRELKQKIQTQITLLHERRTSLISHAVTGKVKV